MKLKLPDTTRLPRRPQQTEHAQVRLVILTLISFLLGVTATTFWFRLNPPRLVPEMNSQNQRAIRTATRRAAALRRKPVGADIRGNAGSCVSRRRGRSQESAS